MVPRRKSFVAAKCVKEQDRCAWLCVQLLVRAPLNFSFRSSTFANFSITALPGLSISSYTTYQSTSKQSKGQAQLNLEFAPCH